LARQLPGHNGGLLNVAHTHNRAPITGMGEHIHINEWMWHNLGRARPDTHGLERTLLVVTLV